MRPGGASQAGVTLVEVLVGFVLVAMLMSLLFGSLRFGTQVRDRVGVASALIEDVAPVRAFLRHNLSTEAVLPPRLHAPMLPHGVVSGTEDSVTWLAPAPLPFAYRGLTELMVFHDPAAGSLEARWRPADLTGSDVPQAWSGQRRLLDGVAAARLQYLWPRDGWRAEWEMGTGDPLAIRIDLSFTDPDRHWAPLVVALPR